MATQIKLMADYQCFPLWWNSDGKVGNIDPSTLPLSNEILVRLDRWAGIFDGWMDLDDPTGGADPEPSQVAAFEEEGHRLMEALRQELSPKFDVTYQGGRRTS